MTEKKRPKSPLEDTDTIAIEGLDDEQPTPAAHTPRPTPRFVPKHGDFLQLPSVEMEEAEPLARPRPAGQEAGFSEAASEPSRRGRWSLLLLLLAVGGAGFYFWKRESVALRQGGPGAQERMAILVDTQAVDFQVLVDGAVVPIQDGRFLIPAQGPTKVVLRRIGYEEETFNLDPKENVRVIRPSFLPRRPSGFLSFETVPSVTVKLYSGDQLVLEAETPIDGQSIPVGKYRAVLENPMTGYRAEEEVVIEDWKTTSVRRTLPGK